MPPDPSRVAVGKGSGYARLGLILDRDLPIYRLKVHYICSIRIYGHPFPTMDGSGWLKKSKSAEKAEFSHAHN